MRKIQLFNSLIVIISLLTSQVSGAFAASPVLKSLLSKDSSLVVSSSEHCPKKQKAKQKAQQETQMSMSVTHSSLAAESSQMDCCDDMRIAHSFSSLKVTNGADIGEHKCCEGQCECSSVFNSLTLYISVYTPPQLERSGAALHSYIRSSVQAPVEQAKRPPIA